MVKKFLFGAAVLAGLLAFDSTAMADVQKGNCSVIVSQHGAKKFAQLKCDRAYRPGRIVIRRTRWEKDDAKAYNKLARLAGRRFTCEITFKGYRRNVGRQFSRYDIQKCK